MPHYHNFGWYYFFKYILGFAGIFFLYSGLKELSVDSDCPPKKEDNESSPTGESAGASVKKDLNTRRRRPVDAAREQVRPSSTRKLKIFRSNVHISPITTNTKYPPSRESHFQRQKRTSISSSDGEIEIRDRNRHRSECCLRLKYQERRNPRSIIRSSSESLRSNHLEINCREKSTRIFNEILRANLQVRKAYTEREYLELKAFAFSVFDQHISQDSYQPKDLNPEISTPTTTSTYRSEESDDEFERNSSSDPYNYPNYSTVQVRLPSCACPKHNPKSPSTSFASVQSHSGTPYFTASSRGKRSDCKAHPNNEQKFTEKSLRCRVLMEESDVSSNEDIRSHINRRRPAGRRVLR